MAVVVGYDWLQNVKSTQLHNQAKRLDHTWTFLAGIAALETDTESLLELRLVGVNTREEVVCMHVCVTCGWAAWWCGGVRAAWLPNRWRDWRIYAVPSSWARKLRAHSPHWGYSWNHLRVRWRKN